jgi:flavin-dependent dehydrogenase
MGRRSPGLEWLDAIGAPPPATESTECGFAYYTRYFTGPHQPKQVAPFLCRYSNFSVLTLPGDNDTWSVTLFAATGDAPLKEFRRNEVLQRVVAACPLNAHWLDGTPITDVVAMAGILDKYRRFVVDDEPVVTGYAAVGDAWACTNPSAGRGMSVGAIQAAALRDVARGYLEDPVGFALRYDAETQRQVAPYFFDQLADDRFRIAQLTAARDGTPPPTPDEGAQRFFTAVMQDATVFRAMLDSVFCLATRGEVLARPDVAERVAAAEPNGGPQLPGPDRAQLLDLIAG